jgi:glycine/D-amino acid oxidase-like deaminating enzyme
VTDRSSAPDVAIVGGGIIGAATAAFLATASARVTLYEREAIAAAASGRNSGVIQHPFDPVLVGLYRESLELYRALASESEGSFSLPAEPAGLLAVGWDEGRARQHAAAWAAIYPEILSEVLSGDSLREIEPALAPDVVACQVAIGYPVVPATATRAFAALAEARGASLRIGREVGLAVRDGVAVGVDLDGEVQAAGSVVVAAGPWTPAIVDPSGTWRPIVSVWGVVADIVLAAPPNHVLEELEIDIEPADESLSDGAGEVAFSLVTAGGASSLGSTFLESEPDASRFADALRQRGARYVPEVAAAQIRGLRSCARPLTLDGRPLVGAIPGLDRAFVAAGNGPWGISTGPATARLMANQVLGLEGGIPAALDPARFGDVSYRGA